MNRQPDTYNRIRPGFVLLLGGGIAVVLIPLWLLSGRAPAGAAAADAQVAPPFAATAAALSATTPTDPDNTDANDATETNHPPPPATDRPVPPPNSPLEAQWGVRFSGARLQPARMAIAVYYEVTAPMKANLLAETNAIAYLVDQASGTRVPLCAPLQKEWPYRTHSRNRSMSQTTRGIAAFPPAPNKTIPGKTYTVLTPNMDGVIKSGSRVSVVIGDTQTEGLIVE